jgi:glycosyltransferase involved in cell wall biosynthesis
MPKILMLLQAPFPPDIRLEKEIKSLSNSGFEVVLLCNQYVISLEPDFKFGRIIRVKALFNNKKLNQIINFPIFFNPRFIFYLIRIYFLEKPDFVHAHDLPMVPLALILKFLFKKKVIFDMHENYPQALRAFNKKGLANFIFKNAYFAEKLEKFCLSKVDKVIVVVEENKNRLIEIGVSENNISVISNTVDLETFYNNKDLIKINAFEGRSIIFYSGTVSPERGLKTAVLSMEYLRESIPNSLLLIIGDGKAVEELNELIIEKHLEENVKLQSWCGHDILPSYIARANLCIIPQPNNDFINTTIPHKLFEYMIMEKPVLVSDAVPLKRIVEETKSGLVFKSESPEDFAKRVIKMYESKINFGQNGKNAVEQKYNWKIDAQILIELYKKL